MIYDNADFGRWLKQRRKSLDLTQEELAKLANCTAETIRKLEAGHRRASKTVAQALADALQLSGPARVEFLHLARPTPLLATGPGSPPPADNLALSDPIDSATLLTTKLYLPRPRSQLVARTRLLTRLEHGLRGNFILIAAPAGFGKTTVLVDWLNQPTVQPRPVAWLGLDAGDSGPLQFLRYLIAALQTLTPSIGAKVLPLLRLTQPPPLVTLMPMVANDLTQVPPGSLLVLDDYHVIDAPAVHQALIFLLDHWPPHVHLVIASRADPPLPLARLRARGQLTELRAHDLRFTTEEASVFLQEVMGIPLTAADVAAIEARTEGWIAGLQLAALSLQDRPTAQISAFIDSFTGSHRFVVDYLVDEVLARQPVTIQRFMIETSILERLCGSLCSAVSAGNPDAEAGERKAQILNSQRTLEYLERANLFIVPLDNERRWYRYHHLFAQVLRERLFNSTSPATIAGLHQRASFWLEENGLIVDAVHHAMAAQDWLQTARLLETHGRGLVVKGNAQLVRNLLQRMPEAVMRAHPFLYLLLGAGSIFVNELEEAKQFLQTAAALLATSDHEDAQSMLGYALILQATTAVYQGDLAQRVVLARQGVEYISPQRGDLRFPGNVHLAEVYKADGIITPENERQLRALIDRAWQMGEVTNVLYANVAMAALQQAQGRLHEAANTYRETTKLMTELKELQALPNSASLYFGLGAILYEWNELAAAEELFGYGLETVRSKRLAWAESVVLGYAKLAFLQQARGEEAAARATMAELAKVTTQQNFATPMVVRAQAAAADLALRQANWEAAVRWADGYALSLGNELDYLAEQANFTLIRIRIAQGRLEHKSTGSAEARKLLTRLLSAAEAGGRWDSVIQLLVLQALALQAQGLPEAAGESLNRVLQLAAPEEYVRCFLDEGEPMASLLRQALAQGSLAANVQPYATTLLTTFAAARIEPATTTNHPPAGQLYALPFGIEPLTTRELEVLQLLATGSSNQAIARKLVVEVGTIKRHVSNIMSKLQAESRLEAVVRARTLHIL